MWGMSSLNERRPSANANCNLISVLSAGSQTEKEKWGRCRRDENDKHKPFPLLFFFVVAKLPAPTSRMFYLGPAACPHAFYGLDCGQMCECRNGARCHHITGACLCTAGWAGPHCILGNGSHIIKTGCEGGPLWEPITTSSTRKHNCDVFVNNYLHNETFANEFLGGGAGGLVVWGGGRESALWQEPFHRRLFWIKAPKQKTLQTFSLLS